ncbi:hypothetical protein K431DRAFT_292211 [Polychaeton citri CBS 116435]|uniref:Uncharacterized protein n=1 Tax=Polychaeton citri CBS 116435 TaxID=1314669 RepID=A0A9P4UTB2_9PEZI|nr:hypothetical protein K431DRAFT_292211 [Polychaeton citri CBS 116435]
MTSSAAEWLPLTTLYVLVPPSPLFAAHWSFFLPNLMHCETSSEQYKESNLGRRIHVTGDRLNGFTLEIVRDYDISKHRSYLLNTIENRETRRSDHCKDEDEGGGYVDNQPVDEFELICTKLEAPGPSLNQVTLGPSTNGSRGRTKRTEIKDCQWWIRNVFEVMMREDMLLPYLAHAEDGKKGLQESLAALPVH